MQRHGTHRRRGVPTQRRAGGLLPVVLTTLLVAACGGDEGAVSCEPDDADGVIGGTYTFEVTVTDQAFSPLILIAQNRSVVTLTLRNEGTVPHGFRIDCLATPNSLGCPAESCFDDAALIQPVAPGGEATTEFHVPRPEGIHDVGDATGAKSPAAQFIVN